MQRCFWASPSRRRPGYVFGREKTPESSSCSLKWALYLGHHDFVSRSWRRLKPKFDWVVPFLTRTWDTVFKNSMKDIETWIDLFNQYSIRPEFEVFDLGQLNILNVFYKRGVIKPPLYIQFVPGVTGGYGMTFENQLFMIEAARKLFGQIGRAHV
jgi:uncharacterized protein (DUF849 family)